MSSPPSLSRHRNHNPPHKSAQPNHQAFSVQDVLDYNPIEVVPTAFEKSKLLYESQLVTDENVVNQCTDPSAISQRNTQKAGIGRIRKKFGRAQSLNLLSANYSGKTNRSLFTSSSALFENNESTQDNPEPCTALYTRDLHNSWTMQGTDLSATLHADNVDMITRQNISDSVTRFGNSNGFHAPIRKDRSLRRHSSLQGCGVGMYQFCSESSGEFFPFPEENRFDGTQGEQEFVNRPKSHPKRADSMPRNKSGSFIFQPSDERLYVQCRSTDGTSPQRSLSSSLLFTNDSTLFTKNPLEVGTDKFDDRISEESNLASVENTSRERKKLCARIHMKQKGASNDLLYACTTGEAGNFSNGHFLLPKAHTVYDGNSSINGMSSPSNRSTASCSRKRVVCSGSTPPPVNLEDWSIGDCGLSASLSLSSRRSRTRIFSADTGSLFEIPLPLGNINNHAAVRRSTESDLSAAGIMCSNGRVSNEDDLYDSDAFDQDERSVDSSSDVSMEYNTNVIAAHNSVTMLTQASILENMSSYEDLKFLTKALRKENRGVDRICNFWNVAPPLVWSIKRRSHFFQWTKAYLGFTMRSAGMSVHFLQISQSKGLEILRVLESTLQNHKELEHQKREECVSSDSKEILIRGESMELAKDKNDFVSIDSHNSHRRLPSSMQSVMKESVHDEIETSMVTELASLSVKESIPLCMSVGEDRWQANKFDPRLSLDSICNGNNRKFLMHCIHGHDSVNYSPKREMSVQSSVPRKGSLLSIDCVQTAQVPNHAGCNLTPYSTVAMMPMCNLEMLTTPHLEETIGWGSRPFKNLDWGTSIRCEHSVLEHLNQRFGEDCRLDVDNTIGCFVHHNDVTGTPMHRIHLDVSEIDPENSNETEEAIGLPDEGAYSLFHGKQLRKRNDEFKKLRRMSVWAAASHGSSSVVRNHKGNAKRFSKYLLSSEDSCSALCSPSEIKEQSSFVFENASLEFLSQEDRKQKFTPFDDQITLTIFSYLTESELLRKVSLVCCNWADLAAAAHAELLVGNVGIEEEDQSLIHNATARLQPVSMECTWESLHKKFPWACYLAEGGAKKVFKVHNKVVGLDEAISVMDTHRIESRQIVANELAVSALLSSLARRGICPNFVVMHGMFTSSGGAPGSHWGTETCRNPKGSRFVLGKSYYPPRRPKNMEYGRYLYIRMELVNEGDAEEMMKRQPNEVLDFNSAKALLFQVAFALYAAAERFSIKHYDIKLLNVFLQKMQCNDGNVVMRYGLGSHVFGIKMSRANAYVAKLADFGTANVNPESNGQPITIAQFTTLENTPPDFMILGDQAKQGHGHDNFCLGLCMLHLFTGTGPYEEIMNKIRCPINLKKRLRLIWENNDAAGYTVINSLIFDGVVKDEAGHIIEGEPDETLYDTLYRYLVLFGIPQVQFQQKNFPKVWKAISDSLETSSTNLQQVGRPIRKKNGSDITAYRRDCKEYSLACGNNSSIQRARVALEASHGGIDLLLRLCSFDPATRASAMDVLNSEFMESFREDPGGSSYDADSTVYEYTAFLTKQIAR